MSYDNEEIKAHVKKTAKYLNHKKQISINLKQSGFDFLKHRVNDIGISYQNIILVLVHNLG